MENCYIVIPNKYSLELALYWFLSMERKFFFRMGLYMKGMNKRD